MVTTRRNADDGTTVNEAEKGGPSQPAPPVQADVEFNDEAGYEDEYGEEEGYEYPMDEDNLEVELLRHIFGAFISNKSKIYWANIL